MYEAAVGWAKVLLKAGSIVSVEGEQDWGKITGSRERCSASGL